MVNLTKLEVLSLFDNQLTGAFPDIFLGMKGLSVIALGSNNLVGMCGRGRARHMQRKVIVYEELPIAVCASSMNAR